MAYYTYYLLLHTTANSFCDYYYISNLSINNLVSKMRLNLHIHTYLYLLKYSSFYKNTILFTSLFVLSSRFRKNENYDTKKTIFNFLSLKQTNVSFSSYLDIYDKNTPLQWLNHLLLWRQISVKTKTEVVHLSILSVLMEFFLEGSAQIRIW